MPPKKRKRAKGCGDGTPKRAKTEFMMLPADVAREIARFAPLRDALNLSACCTTLRRALFDACADRVKWSAISRHQMPSEEFVERNAHRMDWRAISRHQTLSEAFVERHADRVHWPAISIHQTLSEAFVERHADRVDLSKISVPF